MKLLSRMALVITLTATTVAAQTKVTPPKNKYTPQQDVQIGREAAAEVRQQYPVINDDSIEEYLDRLGDRLVEAAPRELNNPAFQYSFTPVNLKDINAFALPGGPMFVNRGMIEAATTRGRSRRRDGARARARAAAPRHRQRHQAAGLSDRRARRRDRRRGDRRQPRARSFRRVRSSASAPG